MWTNSLFCTYIGCISPRKSNTISVAISLSISSPLSSKENSGFVHRDSYLLYPSRSMTLIKAGSFGLLWHRIKSNWGEIEKAWELRLVEELKGICIKKRRKQVYKFCLFSLFLNIIVFYYFFHGVQEILLQNLSTFWQLNCALLAATLC